VLAQQPGDQVRLGRISSTSLPHLSFAIIPSIDRSTVKARHRRLGGRCHHEDDPATRVVLVLLSRLLDWRALLTVVQPDTLIRWHRQGWRLLWRRKSRPGRPPIPRELQRLIVSMAQGNPTWGEERIANELLLNWDWPCRLARWVGRSGVYVRGTVDADSGRAAP
jgi:hypothetical protein